MRKKRNYQDIFKGNSDLPSIEDVDKQVAKLTHKDNTVPAPKSTSKSVPKVSTKTKGRKPLEVKKIPYTTAITEENKFKLKYHAMKKGIRPSDMLDQILNYYFKKMGDK